MTPILNHIQQRASRLFCSAVFLSRLPARWCATARLRQQDRLHYVCSNTAIGIVEWFVSKPMCIVTGMKDTLHRLAPTLRRGLLLPCILGVLAITLTAAPDAHAGRRPFIWVWDTEVLHERDVEMEQWIWERKKKDQHAAWLWWAPVIGVTDRLELAIPLEGVTTWGKKTGAAAGDPDTWQTGTRIARYGVELRWRLAENDPEEAGPFVPLIRVAVKRRLGNELAWLLEGNLVGSLDFGDVHAALDLGAFHGIGGSAGTWLTYASGLTYGKQDGLRVGAELFGEVGLSKGWKSFLMVGPNVAWTHGRTWLTFGCLIGTTEHAADWMPRLLWAIKL